MAYGAFPASRFQDTAGDYTLQFYFDRRLGLAVGHTAGLNVGVDPTIIPIPPSPKLEAARALFHKHITPHLTGLNLAIAAVIALITVGFGVITVLMILTATNFNVLSWIE